MVSGNNLTVRKQSDSCFKCYHIPEKSAPSFVSTDFMPLHITNAVANKKAVWLLPKFVDISKYLRKKTEKGDWCDCLKSIAV